MARMPLVCIGPRDAIAEGAPMRHVHVGPAEGGINLTRAMRLEHNRAVAFLGVCKNVQGVLARGEDCVPARGVL